MCCDGTLFKDVEFQPGDDAAREAMQAIKVEPGAASRRTRPANDARAILKLPQPCAALCSDLRCRIYAGRPSRCRAFECRLLIAVGDRTQDFSAALKIIRQTRQVADKARRLLRALGDHDEQLPLSRRFRRMRRQCEASALREMSETAAGHYAELTLAIHQLQLLLQREFYPGPG